MACTSLNLHIAQYDVGPHHQARLLFVPFSRGPFLLHNPDVYSRNDNNAVADGK